MLTNNAGHYSANVVAGDQVRHPRFLPPNSTMRESQCSDLFLPTPAYLHHTASTDGMLTVEVTMGLTGAETWGKQTLFQNEVVERMSLCSTATSDDIDTISTSDGGSSEHLPSTASSPTLSFRSAALVSIQPPPGLDPPQLMHKQLWARGGDEKLHGNTRSDAVERYPSNQQVHSAFAPRRRGPRRRCQLLMATHLRTLDSEDANCVLLVRQISKLRFDSPALIRKHCEQYGSVLKVLVSNSHDRDGINNSAYPVRLRPSGIAIVLFKYAQSAQAVLNKGEVQSIAGIDVRFCKFFRKLHATSVNEIDES